MHQYVAPNTFTHTHVRIYKFRFRSLAPSGDRVAQTCIPIYIYIQGTANPTWGDIFECCFKAQSSKLERLFCHVSALSFELSKMSPQVGLAVQVGSDVYPHSVPAGTCTLPTRCHLVCIYIWGYKPAPPLGALCVYIYRRRLVCPLGHSTAEK